MKNPLLCYNKHKKSFKQLIKGEECGNGTGTPSLLPKLRRAHRTGTALLCQLRPTLRFSPSSGRQRSRLESTAIDTVSTNFAASSAESCTGCATMAQYRSRCACLVSTFLYTSSKKANLRWKGLCTYLPGVAYPFRRGQLSQRYRLWYPPAWTRQW